MPVLSDFWWKID